MLFNDTKNFKCNKVDVKQRREERGGNYDLKSIELFNKNLFLILESIESDLALSILLNNRKKTRLGLNCILQCRQTNCNPCNGLCLCVHLNKNQRWLKFHSLVHSQTYPSISFNQSLWGPGFTNAISLVEIENKTVIIYFEFKTNPSNQTHRHSWGDNFCVTYRN